jgi:hypothetical protein
MKISIKISIVIFALSTMFFNYVQSNKNMATGKSIFFVEEVFKDNMFALQSKHTQNNTLNNLSFFKKLIQNKVHTWAVIPMINEGKINLINNEICASKIGAFSKY